MPTTTDDDFPATADLRYCGFDGAVCSSTNGCRIQRTCLREDTLNARSVCTVCDPPRQCRDLRGYAAHMRIHEEPVPCPNGCGRTDLKPSGVKRHLRVCGLVVRRVEPEPEPVSAVPRPEIRVALCDVGDAQVSICVVLDGTLGRQKPKDAALLRSLYAILDRLDARSLDG